MTLKQFKKMMQGKTTDKEIEKMQGGRKMFNKNCIFLFNNQKTIIKKQ